MPSSRSVGKAKHLETRHGFFKIRNVRCLLHLRVLAPLGRKEDRFLHGREIAYRIYDYFGVTGAHDTVLDHADTFKITFRNDDVQEVDSFVCD